ncbi:MAG TPA: PAS domain S-box protein [Candidatus Deferrimicrobium sp.]|nr:PAS domain S-box protein [Candidatus Deferrimicrobium sp.]
MQSSLKASAKKQQTPKLLEGRKYFQVVADLPTPVIIWDKFNSIEHVNKATIELVQRFHSVYPAKSGTGIGDRCPWLEQDLEDFIAQGGKEYIVCKVLGTEEDSVHLEVKFMRLTDFHGTYCGNAAIIKDISDLARREVEQALRESEERYRRLVELSPDAIAVHCQGKFVYVNPSMLKLLGAEREEQLLGHPVIETMHPDYRSMVKERMRQAQDGAVGQMIEERVIRLDGTVVDVEVMATPTKYRGEPAVQVTGHEITERKKYEEEHIKNSKLESLGIMAGGIAHDFNNILTIILGNISLARASVERANKIHTRLEEVEKAAFEAISLTQQLLTFAKGGKPVKNTISIGRLISESTTFALRGSNVRSEYEGAEDLWPVEVDEAQIKQVINNLLINAQQAMPNGGTISVKAENIKATNSRKISATPPKGEYVKISIADCGIGISAETLPKIFDPYFTTKENGNGLGLATVYSIIKKHNGYITVKSIVGEGTTFFIYLARSQEKLLHKKHKLKPMLKGKGRVLVVDDEAKIRNLVCEMLEHMGYDYESVPDGLAALELYKQRKDSAQGFDIVIMDLTIPGGMGGKEAIREFIKLDPSVKGIVSSGYSDAPVMADYRRFGFRGCVSKPYRIEELGSVLQQVLQEK